MDEQRKALTREEVVAAIKKRHTEVEYIDVPEWGGNVCVRRMTAQDVERSGLVDASGKPDAGLFATVMAAALVTEEGEPLFDDESAAALVDVDMVTAARVFAEIMRINGLSDEELEEAVKSFARAQPSPSATS